MGKGSFLSERIIYTYFMCVARSTAKRAYFTPLIPALHPYPISMCMTLLYARGSFAGDVEILGLLLVDISPILTTDSRSKWRRDESYSESIRSGGE